MKSRTLVFLTLSLAFLVGCGARTQPTGLRVAVIGLDGATWNLLDPWIEEGILPNIERIRREGFSTGLLSVVPPLSAPAWTTAITGTNPGRHGIFNFDHFDRERFLPFPATSLDRKTKAVWEYLTESNRRSIAVAIPLTSPPDSLNGVMISGFPHLSESGFTFPPELEQELVGYRLHKYGEYLMDEHEDAFLNHLYAVRESHGRVGLDLYRRKDWDLFWFVFLGTDKIQHFFWKFMDAEQRGDVDPATAEMYRHAIRDFWIDIDRLVGDFVEATDSNTVLFVVSDHGFGPIHREMRVLRWLWDEGYCDINPTRSRVLYLPHYGGELAINRKDRFPNGVVAPGEEYEQLMSELTEKLLAVRDPANGKRVVSEVFRADRIYSGPHLDEAPDLLFLPEPGYFFGRGSPMEEGGTFGVPSYTFSAFHDMRGIFLVRGPHVRPGRGEKDLRLLDLAPTALRLLGETIPLRMDGRPFEGPFEESLEGAAPIRFADRPIEREVSDRRIGEMREKLDKLQALPYLR